MLKLKKKTNFEKLKKTIDKTKNLKTLVLGEIIIDEYIFSTPLGKSPKEHLISMQEIKKETYGVVSSHQSTIWLVFLMIVLF